MTDAEIVLLINSGMQEVGLAHPLWPWLEEYVLMSLDQDAQVYDLPDDFSFMLSVVDNDSNKALKYLAPSSFFQKFGQDASDSSADPLYYTIYAEQLWFSPIPNADDDDRITLFYYIAPPTLDAGSDEPTFAAAFHPILVEYCKWKLWNREEYFDQSERAFVTFARYLDQMITWYGRRAKQSPYVVGDGVFTARPGDPNLAWIWEV